MIRVTGDRVLVVLPPKPEEQDPVTGYTFQHTGDSPSGIVLAKPPDRFNLDIATRGLVVQLGEKKGQVDVEAAIDALREFRFQDGVIDCQFADVELALRGLVPAPFEVAVGDLVLFAPTAGDAVMFEGIEYVILREDEILGIVDPLQSEAA